MNSFPSKPEIKNGGIVARTAASREKLTRQATRRFFGMVGAVAVVASSLVLGGELVAPPTPAYAADPFLCVPGSVYAQDSNSIHRFDVTTGALEGTAVATGQQGNGLGLSSGGRFAYTVTNAAGTSTKTIVKHDRVTNTNVSTIQTTVNTPIGVLRGAVNPANDAYYFASGTSAGGAISLFAWNEANNSVVTIGTMSPAAGSTAFGSNGDMAFSASGQLLLVADRYVYSVDVPATVAPVSGMQAREIADLGLGVAGNGIAFGNLGNIFVSAGSPNRIIEVNIPTGVIQPAKQLGASFGVTDLASCTFPNTLNLTKDLPGNRYQSGDQFTLGIKSPTGYKIAETSVTTTGSTAGVQPDFVGPVFTNQGDTFFLSEQAVGATNLSAYNTSLSCTQITDAGTTELTATPVAGGWNVVQPAASKGTDVTCVVSNDAHAPSIELTKSTDLSAPYVVGDTITYTFVAKNTGNVPLTGVTITDPLAGLSALTNFVWPGAPNELQVGETVTAEATIVVTQEHVNAGGIENTATATGTPPVGNNVTDTSTVNVPFVSAPEITLEKNITSPQDYAVGDTITYEFKATNTGNVTLTEATIADPLPGLSALSFNWDNATAEGTLDPGEFVTATATLLVTQDHMNAGGIQNTATAVGTPPTGDAVNSSDSVDLPLTTDPAISLTKTADVTTPGLGDTVTYTFEAENTGNVTLNGVTIADPLPGLSSLTYSDWPGAPNVLQPGEAVTATATVVVTQAHLDQQWIYNTATVQGTPPSGPNVEDVDSVKIVPLYDPSIKIVKTGLLDGAAAAGEMVSYSFTATNTGNVTLTDVTITDPLTGLSVLVYDWSGATAEGVLAPGESVSATASYELTQADVDSGSVVNLATAVGTPPALTDPLDPDAPAVPQEPVEDTDPETVPLPQGAALQFVKSGVLTETGSAATIGDEMVFTFTATNTGNVTLTDVTITDPLPGLSALTYDWSAATGVGTLAPGETVTATATYALTQADIDAGHVANTGSVTGTPPTTDPGDPAEPLPPVEDDSIVPVPPAPSVELVKSSDLGAGAIAGDAVEYSFTATNTGNVTLMDVTITDPLPGLSALTYDWSGATADGVLAPGESVTATATLVLTQDHVDAGWVKNTATVVGTPPNVFDPADPDGPGTPADPVTDDSTVVTPVPADPSIEIVKTGQLDGAAVAGEMVSYSFTATNTGNVTLTGVTITDPLSGLSALTYDWSGTTAEGTLAPGESVSATASYELTQNDVNAGSVVNLATAAGTPPSLTDPLDPDAPAVPQEPVEDTDPETVPLDQSPALQLVKSGALTETGAAATVGDEMVFTFTATNIGNVTLTDVAITDELPGLSTLTYDWSAATAAGTLAPGEVVTATATYLLTQADVDAGHVANTGSVTGTPPTTDPENPAPPLPPVEGETVVPVPPAPSIEIVKTSDLVGNVAAGSVVNYSFTATNTGNVTLTGVTISDPLVGLSSLTYDWSAATAPGTLAPGETVTATATLTVTQDHVDAGWVLNTAAVVGTPPNVFDPEDPDGPGTPSDPVTNDSTVVTELPADPSIEVVKTGLLDGAAVAGEMVSYSFTATNTGNVTLTDVVITDPLSGLSELVYDWTGLTEGLLAPGESVSATASYELTQNDVNAGSVVNLATAVGTPPALTDPLDPDAPAVPQEPVEDTDPETVPLPQGPALQLVKSGALTETGAAATVGDEVMFTFTATNIGNVTLTNVTISDPLPGLSGLTYDWSAATGVGTLAPGETVTATATYVLTDADVDAGHVANTGSVTGTPPTTDPENPAPPLPPVEDETVVPVPPAPSIEIVKSSDLAAGAAAGDTVSYSFTATNTGNVTLTGVAITDPLPGLSALTYDWAGATADGVLAPGESVTATATLVLTQDHVDAGWVKNTATVAGTPPNVFDPADPDGPGTPAVPVTDDSTVVTPVPADPAIEVVKTSDLVGDVAAGSVVGYTFTATNTGNVTLTNVSITDPLAGLSALEYDWSGLTVGTLAPGETVTASAALTVTQEHVDAGWVLNTASVVGTPPATTDPEDPDATAVPSDPVTDDSTVVTELPADPSIDVVKTGQAGGERTVGDRISYTIVATNTGNVTLTDVVIVDKLSGLSALVYDWSAATAEGVLAPGEFVVATATYTITAADAANGSVVNNATAEGTPPAVSDPNDPDAPAVPADPVNDDDSEETRVGALAVTGGNLVWQIPLGGGVMLVAAGILMIIRQRSKGQNA